MTTVLRTTSATPKYLTYGNLNADPEQQLQAALDAPNGANGIDLLCLDPNTPVGLRQWKVMTGFGVYLACEDRGENRVMVDTRNDSSERGHVGHDTFHVERVGSSSTKIEPGDAIAIWYRSTRQRNKKLFWTAPPAGGGVTCVAATAPGPYQTFILEDGPSVVEVTTDPLPAVPYSLQRSATGTIRLAAPAASMGATVQLSTDTSFVTVTPQIVVPSGMTTAPFDITLGGYCKQGDGSGQPPCSTPNVVITAAAPFGTGTVTQPLKFDGGNPFVSVGPPHVVVDPGSREVVLLVRVLPDARATNVDLTVSSGNNQLTFPQFQVRLRPGETHTFSAISNGPDHACAIVSVVFQIPGRAGSTPACNKPQFPILVTKT